MITTQEANYFLSHQIKFKNWQNVLQNDKLKFLQLLVPYYAHNMHFQPEFQNISMSSVADNERKFPDKKDIIEAGLNGVGGNCIFQNGFLALLLQSLGFDAFVVAGTFQGPGFLPDNHVICIVRLNADELYLLDLRVTLPFAEPVQLHNLPYVNRAVGCRYSYRKVEENGMYARTHTQLDGALFGGEYEDKDTEFVRYDFTLEPKTFEFFKKPLSDFFIEPTKSYFLQHPFLFRYFNENEKGELHDEVQTTGNRKFIHIRGVCGVSILIGDDNTKVVKHMSSYNEIKEVILKYFPKHSETQLNKSLKCFNENSTDEYFKVVSAHIY